MHAVQYMMLALVRWWRPTRLIEPAPDFPVRAFGARRTKLEPLPLSAAFHDALGNGSEPRLVVGGIW